VQLDEKAWFLYVLRCADDTLYTGTTTDISRRIDEHNTKKCGAKYTKTRRPVELIFWLDFENRSQAQKAEYKFKKLTRTQKEKIINASR
jgi:putative endonuclease